MAIKENLLKVRERIVSACSKINRDPDSITIVAVSKGRTVEQIREAVSAGIADIGENKVQEALGKYQELEVNWHMVGHLQTNKARDAVRIFDLIQSVDSLRLAQEINKQAALINKVQDILIEVKTSPEATKFGLSPEEAIEAIKEISNLKNIKSLGLMTIAPMVHDPEQARPYFIKLRELSGKTGGMRILSMGMTDDFEVAIEEGANMVRIGRAIFEG